MGNCAGAILAGGKSSRMGEDKVGLRLNGHTLLRHMEDLLKEADIENIYISHPDHIPDDIVGLGPLSGIHAILKVAAEHHKHVLFVPIDMPCLTAVQIGRLMSAPDSASLVHFDSHKMPFRLSADNKWRELAEGLLQTKKNVSLGHFQKQIAARLLVTLKAGEEACFQNMNTPQEWNTFMAGGPT